jgi:ParB-like chromosome segregation protein Spo0J
MSAPLTQRLTADEARQHLLALNLHARKALAIQVSLPYCAHLQRMGLDPDGVLFLVSLVAALVSGCEVELVLPPEGDVGLEMALFDTEGGII